MIDLREWATQTIIHLVWRKRESRGRRGERDGVKGGERRERGRERWSIGNGREKKEEEVQEDRGKEEEGDEGAEGGGGR